MDEPDVRVLRSERSSHKDICLACEFILYHKHLTIVPIGSVRQLVGVGYVNERLIVLNSFLDGA